VIFVQEQFSRKAARMVAEAIGARIETIDPLAEDYPENLRRVARLFVEAMKP
jgi:zinc transport system substrate-binding protein